MEIEGLKEALGDETFAKLEGYIEDLKGQRDSARDESIKGRKTMKERLSTLESQNTALLDKLGIGDFEELDDVTTPQGAAEATKQLESKLSRLTRELEDAQGRASEAESLYRDSQKRIKLNEALGGHDWVANDLVESFISPRLEFEGDDLLYKDDSGRLVSVSDGVAMLAKARPELLKPTGTGGAGVSSSGARGSADKSMTRADFEALSPSEKMEVAQSGVELH